MERRTFIKNGTITAAGLSILPEGTLFARSDRGAVRLGYIGVGARGMNHIGEGCLRDDVEIVAICDTQESSLKICRSFIAEQEDLLQRNIQVVRKPTKNSWKEKILMP